MKESQRQAALRAFAVTFSEIIKFAILWIAV
jgi:hypothetical protein